MKSTGQKANQHWHSRLRVTISLGEKDKAFAWLEKSFQEREGDLIYLNVDDRFAALRSDPRFQNLLHLIGLG